MIKRNPCLGQLPPASIFPEVCSLIETFRKQHPLAKLISLSVGDTSQPLPPFVVSAFKEKAERLGTPQGYTGYGPEWGESSLRETIADTLYKGKFKADEVFISDGAKCDVGRLQILFGNDVSVAVQDPTYTVYVDSSVLLGQRELIYLPCLPTNNFIPAWKKSDLLFFCSPNNPTGNAATREELASLVETAERNNSIIIYDAAYSHFITDRRYPRSIYEIEGAEKVAIELGSFSKMAGFTGVRLSWSVVPHALKYQNGHSVNTDWTRVVVSLFNGPSNLAQAGALALLSEKGQQEIERLTSFYMENASLLKEAFLQKGFQVYGGEQSPYLWVDTKGKNSWDFFYDLLTQAHLITMPGIGFGASGEGFIRVSAFGKREEVKEAIRRLAAYEESHCHTADCRS